MEQKDFQHILRRYLHGQATPEEKKLIDKWYSAMEQKSPHQNIEDESDVEARLWSTISGRLRKSDKITPVRNIRQWYISGIAASIVVLIVAFYFVSMSPRAEKDVVTRDQAVAFSWKHLTNTTKAPQLFVLPDNSKVTIQPGGKLRFSSKFDEVSREVYLEGEAFFEVSKNAERPFFVYANEVTTRVLGTSFTVKAIEQEKQVTIAVKTGIVSVYSNSKNNNSEKLTQAEEIILTPNQQVVFETEEKKISKKLVEKPEIIIPEEQVNRMRFEETPVPEIFKALEKVYGVDIVFDEEILSSCELTTVITGKELFVRLDIICNAIGASYVLEEATIKINSEGCK